jgi:hypothetical protein
MNKVQSMSYNKINKGVNGKSAQELVDIWKTVDDSNGLPQQHKDHDV